MCFNTLQLFRIFNSDQFQIAAIKIFYLYLQFLLISTIITIILVGELNQGLYTFENFCIQKGTQQTLITVNYAT